MAIDLPDLLSECAAFPHTAVASLAGLNGSIDIAYLYKP